MWGAMNPFNKSIVIEFDNYSQKNIKVVTDSQNIPVALEILDASKYFRVKPYALRNFALDMNIHIQSDKITLKAKFIISTHHKKEEVPVNVGTINGIELPTMQTSYAVA